MTSTGHIEPSKRKGFWGRRPRKVLLEICSFCFAFLACCFAPLHGETVLQTKDTRIVLQAAPSSPHLVSVRAGSGPEWRNSPRTSLVRSAEVDGRLVSIHWSFNAQRSVVSARRVSYVYESASPRLRLIWEWEARADFGPLEHECRIENLGTTDIWLALQDSLQFDFLISPQVPLEHIFIEKGADTPSAEGTHAVAVPDGYQWLGESSTYARSREGQPREIIPWFLIRQAEGDRKGLYVGIEFSGRTSLSMERSGNHLRGRVGLNGDPAPYRTRLVPNAVFATPRIFVGASNGDLNDTSNVLRRWVRDVLTNAATWRNPAYPLAVNNSWGGGLTINEDVALRMIRDAAELGFEMFHVDAGWFRAVGDWHPDPAKFPHGMAAIAAQAHAHGMKFGLWADWAQAGSSNELGALNVRSPEVAPWLSSNLATDWKPEQFKGETIDIGVPAAKSWALSETDRIVTEYKLDMLEHDGYLVLQGCQKANHPHAPPDPAHTLVEKEASWAMIRSSNSTDVSYYATKAYYEIQSNLRKNHPGLLLEICNDGGRMIDFGSAAHGDYFSITDTYDPLSNRRAFYDTSWLLPPAMLESYVERWATPDIPTFRFMLRSGMMGWLSVMIDTTTWTADQHAAAASEIAVYKNRLRPLIRDADLYHISERPDGKHWDGMQYFDRHRKVGVVFAFRGSAGESTHTFLLKGLRPDAQYKLTFHDGSASDRIAGGKELLRVGLPVALTQPNSSELVFIEEIPHAQGGTTINK